MNLLQKLKENPFVLAPMAGITDHSFRSFMKRMGAGVVVTELVSATGIEFSSERTLQLMSFDESQHPIGIQLFGEDPEIMARAALKAQEMGADFVDLNFGCPVPKVVKKGAGSAILKDLPHLTLMIQTIRKAIQIPLTIKVRTGWDQSTRNADEVANIAFNEGVTWMAIHGRTRAQAYAGFADWDYIAAVKAKAKLPILGNGDIVTADQAVSRLKKSGCDGVLIGRGALKNPLIFKQSLDLLRNSASENQLDMSQVYFSLAEELASRCDERILQIQLKKFASWFTTGYPNSAQFRRTIFQCQNTEEVLKNAEGFFLGLKQLPQENMNNEGFLMGGHG